MRKWAFFDRPFLYNGLEMQKIMLYQTPCGETYVFLYTQKDAQHCQADEWYADWQKALDVWDNVPHSAWIAINDPLPDCQHDAALPIRVKGRQLGKPLWGQYEILQNGQWHDYTE